jgi:hypothetical protein
MSTEQLKALKSTLVESLADMKEDDEDLPLEPQAKTPKRFVKLHTNSHALNSKIRNAKDKWAGRVGVKATEQKCRPRTLNAIISNNYTPDAMVAPPSTSRVEVTSKPGKTNVGTLAVYQTDLDSLEVDRKLTDVVRQC